MLKKFELQQLEGLNNILKPENYMKETFRAAAERSQESAKIIWPTLSRIFE